LIHVTGQSERANKLLALVHTDDFSRYSYIYVMRHNHTSLNPSKSSRSFIMKYKINLAR
jgi:hypothetical protein